MFDFQNLDHIDDGGAAPEYLKWQGVPEWQRATPVSQAVLEDFREEQFAPPEKEEDYVFEKLDVPALGEDAYDPLGLASDSVDAIDDKLASFNGQVIVNFIANAFEEFMVAEYDKEQKRSYIDGLLQERLAILAASTAKTPHSEKKKFDDFKRQKFGWREVTNPAVGDVGGLPDGGAYAEKPYSSEHKLLKQTTKIQGVACVPPSTLIAVAVTLANIARPMPAGRLGRNAEWHIAFTDVFFPSGLILDAADEYIQGTKEAPTLVHLVAMSVNKEAGSVEPKHMLETVKLTNPNLLPLKRPGNTMNLPEY